MVTIIKKLTGGAYPFYEYACLSTDIKPVSLVPDNSICHEIDTGKHFYCANGAWHELPPRGGSEDGGGLPADFPAEGNANANKFLGFDANGDYTAKDAPSGGGAEKFIVTLTEDDSGAETVWTADKTIAEIIAASIANRFVVASVPISVNGTTISVEVPLSYSIPTYNIVSFDTDIFVQNVMHILVSGSVDSESDEWTVMTEDVGDSIPSYSSSNNGKVLGVSSGSLAWVDNYAPLIVTMTLDNGSFVGDATYSMVKTAMDAGRSVILKVTGIPSVGDLTISVLFCTEYEEDNSTMYDVNFILGESVTSITGTANADVTITFN
jgi:hypothetical protein